MRCGLIGTASIICCKDDTTITTTAKPTSTKSSPDFTFPSSVSTGNVKPPAIPSKLAERKCVQACEKIKAISAKGFNFHIINGDNADPAEFPHMTVFHKTIS